MPERKFNIGDKVMARWPGSNLFFEGEVEDFNDIEYLVKFDDPDESKLAIKYSNVTTFRSRSQSRGRSPGRPSKRGTSAGRAGKGTPGSKSPGRGKKTSRSPARKPKTESKADESKTSSKDSKSPSRRSNLTPDSNSTSKLPSNSTSSIFSFSSRSSDIVDTPTKNPQRQSARIATMEKANDVKTVIRTTTTTTSTSSTHSNKSISRTHSALQRVVGVMSAVWGVVFPALKTLPLLVLFLLAPLLLTQACTKKNCTILELPDLPTKLESYYDPKAILLALGSLFLYLLLAYLPVKTRVLPSGARAKGNGIVTLLIVCLLLPLATYLKLNVQLVYKLIRQLLTTHTCMGVVLALVLYGKSYFGSASRQVNPRTTGHFLPDLVEGREVTPRLGSVDLKTFFLRYGIVCTVVLNVVLILRDMQMSKGGYNYSLLLICGLQIIYCLDWLWFEDTFYTSWEYTRQGTGLMMTVGYLTVPYYMAVSSRLVSNYNPNLPWYCLVGVSLVFLAGYVLMRASNNQKHAFRTNPSSPHLAQLESLPTSAGTRLLVSGWWGVVRHPNYIGDLIIQVAYVLICGFKFGLPWVLVALSTLMLFVRVYECEESCGRKYGLSWNTYTARVKYRLVPKVF